MNQKNYYGISLGITQSSICRVSNGVPDIIKTDTLKDSMPSCISVTRRGAIKVGDSAINDKKSEESWPSTPSNTYFEFVGTMGTDKIYHCSHLGRDFTSEELSAEVLKALRALVNDDVIDEVVITVPAKFTFNQKAATMQAAKLAGFEHCELLQEPIAASMAYGLSSAQKDGIWMVFDFGDCSFNVALAKVENGIIQVFDNAGDNYLGGKNLYEAIVDEIFIPYLKANFSIEGILSDNRKYEFLRCNLKYYAESANKQLSLKESEDIISNQDDLGEDEDGEEIELDLTLTQAQVFNVMRPYFQKAVDICKKLLERNILSGKQLSKLILVGGPTRSPLIRKMLREQITSNIDDIIDPESVLATGAAIYASTIYTGTKESGIKQDTIRLDVGYESTTNQTTEWVSIKLLDKSHDNVMVELVRNDKAWSSGKTKVNAVGNMIEAMLLKGEPNTFSIVAYDVKGNQIPCNPGEMTIIQGLEMGPSLLPYSFTVGYRDDLTGLKLLRPVLGLERNKPLPAIGTIKLRTTSQLRAGNQHDSINIPVYQVDGSYDVLALNPAFLNEHVADIVITGEEVNALIPEGSSVEITLKVNRSEMMKMEVFFPSCDLTIERELDTSKKQSIPEILELNERDLFIAHQKIKLLNINGFDTLFAQSQINKVIDMINSNSNPETVHLHLKELLKELYKH